MNTKNPYVVNGTKVTRHIVLHRNGDPIHFDVTVDFEACALQLGKKAEENRTYAAVVAGGAVQVRLVT